MIPILISRARVKLAGAMSRNRWAILEAEEAHWLSPGRPPLLQRRMADVAQAALAGALIAAAAIIILTGLPVPA